MKFSDDLNALYSSFKKLVTDVKNSNLKHITDDKLFCDSLTELNTLLQSLKTNDNLSGITKCLLKLDAIEGNAERKKVVLTQTDSALADSASADLASADLDALKQTLEQKMDELMPLLMKSQNDNLSEITTLTSEIKTLKSEIKKLGEEKKEAVLSRASSAGLEYKSILEEAVSHCAKLRTQLKKEVYLDSMTGLLQGPRMKSRVTKELEKLATALLVSTEQSSCHYDENRELIIKIGNQSYNLTQILKRNPDFEHLEFSEETLEKYLPDKKLQYLHEAENVAINTYSGSENKNINQFLRNHAQNISTSSSEDLLNKTKSLLLTICIASHGIHKMLKEERNLNEKNSERGSDYKILLRGESYVTEEEKANRIKELQASNNQQLSHTSAFTSTSPTNPFSGNVKLVIIHPELGYASNIDEMAKLPENEYLFPPGTQFKYLDSVEENGTTYVTAIPTRSLDCINIDDAQQEIEISEKRGNIISSPSSSLLSMAADISTSNDKKVGVKDENADENAASPKPQGP